MCSFNDERVRDRLRHARQDTAEIDDVSARRQRPQHYVIAVRRGRIHPYGRSHELTEIEAVARGLSVSSEIAVAFAVDSEHEIGNAVSRAGCRVHHRLT